MRHVCNRKWILGQVWLSATLIVMLDPPSTHCSPSPVQQIPQTCSKTGLFVDRQLPDSRALGQRNGPIMDYFIQHSFPKKEADDFFCLF